ncbi:unnamed protein product [Clavelina lepadiformis]|uniref:Large ribosomal subunit protein uL22m n=1 Tax=Clavelina lepadiformis TaxID=159417 RepID=A0ABP0G4U9_CLALP
MATTVPSFLLRCCGTLGKLMQNSGYILGTCSHFRGFHQSAHVLALRDPGQHRRIREQAQQHVNKWHRDLGEWTDKNEMLYPPMNPEDGIRPAEIYHGRAKIRYPTKKMIHVSCLVLNMNIDEAISKLDYINNKGAKIIREVLLEAQELAVKEHNVEFKSNLHVATSFTSKHSQIKFPIFRAAGRPPAIGHCRFANYYVMLREGPAPLPEPKITALDSALEYVESLRRRTIRDGL